MNSARLLNKAAVRELLLATADKERPFNHFRRVSEATFIHLNEIVRQAAVNHVKRAPSKGVTL